MLPLLRDPGAQKADFLYRVLELKKPDCCQLFCGKTEIANNYIVAKQKRTKVVTISLHIRKSFWLKSNFICNKISDFHLFEEECKNRSTKLRSTNCHGYRGTTSVCKSNLLNGIFMMFEVKLAFKKHYLGSYWRRFSQLLFNFEFILYKVQGEY